MTSLRGRRILLGVTGGIAAYKSCLLVRRLREAGATVEVVLTEGGARFVGAVTFEALSGHPVRTALWRAGAALDHVRLAREADLVLVAPATAHLIARAALGLADDLLSALLLAREGPVLLAPAMNDRMYAAPPTRQHLASLVERGWYVVGPATGCLAEGESDAPGRMSEPETILRHVERVLTPAGPLTGRHVLVTAGPSREPIDPVRLLTNRSSGKMGYRLAEAAWRRGAQVTLVSGPSAEPPPAGIELLRFETTAELHEAVAQRLPAADVLIMAAAPADFRPAAPHAAKRPRNEGTLRLDLEPTEDILSATRALRRSGAVVVGFALETGDPLEKGRAKLERKALDLIVINDALERGAGFEVDTNKVTILSRRGRTQAVPLASKRVVADAILDAVENELSGRPATVSQPPT